MASLFNLSVKLNAEDKAVFQSLQASALFPSLASPGEGELVALYKQKDREFKEKRLEPYADILEAELTKYLTERKDDIYQKLLKSETNSFVVELFSWKTIKFNESLTQLRRRESLMTSEQLREHRAAIWARNERIRNDDIENTFSVERTEVYDGEEETSWTLYPEKVEKIFRFTDLALRLSLFLGPNFYPFTTAEYSDEERMMGDNGYSVFKKTLYVRYYPFGVGKQQMDKLLACAKKEAKRKAEGAKTCLRWGEYGVGHSSLNTPPAEPVSLLGGGASSAPADEEAYSDMPPLVPATKVKRFLGAAERDGVSSWAELAREQCFCGCGDE